MLYRQSMRTISRGRGQLAVAIAAYITGQRLYVEREHEIYDYSFRQNHVGYKELIGAFGWSRAELWNEAEWSETRWDGVTAREFLVALPCELGEEERTRLARDFARWLHRQYGWAVDLAIHAPDALGGQDERNHHAHLLVTVRVMSADGLQERTRVWDHKLSGGRELRRVRAAWRRMYNKAMERAGLDLRVDERSYRDQGLDRLPGIHLGPVRSRLERAGTPTEAGDYNRGVDLLNRIRAAAGHRLDWDWEEKARRFGDADGHQAYWACHTQSFRLRQAEETLKRDPTVLSSDKAREIRAHQRELVALKEVLRPCRDIVREERIRRRKLREQERKRSRGKLRGHRD